MASYHLSAQVFSRAAGHSSVAAAAYRGRCALTDERTGLVHDYSRKAGDVLFSGVYPPRGAPDWTRDRAQLWNHVEAFERRRDAQLAREFVIALPCELTLEQNRYALQDWIRENFSRRGLIADAAIHKPDRDGDHRNVHAHVMVVLRRLDGTEFAAKKERAESIADRKAELENLRESWERIGNRHLERYGHAPTLDRRSLLAQGVEREPTKHMGKSATAVERKGKPSELGSVNREIKADNERRVIDLAAERAEREARTAARSENSFSRVDRATGGYLSAAVVEPRLTITAAEIDANPWNVLGCNVEGASAQLLHRVFDTAVSLQEEALRRRDEASYTPEEAALWDDLAEVAKETSKEVQTELERHHGLKTTFSFAKMERPTTGAFMPPDAMARLFAREAAGRGEAAPAAVRPGPWNTRATEARSAPWTQTPTPRSAEPPKNYSKRDVGRETGKTERATEKTVGKAAGVFGSAIVGLLSGLVKWLDLFPAPPPSPEQQERNHYAAQEQQATDELAAQREIRVEDILRHNDRLRQERERKRRERGGYDDDYGRGRERD